MKKEPTIAEAFHLHTERMKKNKKMSNRGDSHNSKRSLPVCSANGQIGEKRTYTKSHTKHEPFNLSKSNKKSKVTLDRPEGEYVPLKVQMEKFFEYGTACGQRANAKDDEV